MAWKKIEISEISCNPFTAISEDWFLLTAGNEASYNTMTAAWGGMGMIWNRNTITAYVRSSRHTFSFMEDNELFTVSFFDEDYRKVLQICGTKSGRNCDKAMETGLTPAMLQDSVTFEQAKLVFVCKKMYAQDLDQNQMLDPAAVAFYEKDAMHRMYIGEIIGVYEQTSM